MLMVLLLMGLIMGATLTSLTQTERSQATNSRQNDSQDQARRSLGTVARELRNLASPTNEQPKAVERAQATDLIFQSVVASGTRRVRYCLDTQGKRVWRQTQPLTTPEPPATTACPAATSSGWGAARAAAENVVNGGRPLFTYNATELTAITEIEATLYVDVNPGATPDESVLQTSVFLRNQNRSPVARFTADVQGGNSIVLNGTASEDPEEKALDYYWYDEGRTGNDPGCGTLPQEVPQSGCVGIGIVFNYSPSTLGSHTVYLVARDPAGLTNRADSVSRCLGVCTG
jgi:hypothetical protein